MAGVELQGVAKVYPGGVEALASFDLSVGDGELAVIVGPSGSGKSTILRLIAGLEAPSSGTIRIGGRRVDGLPPRDRDVAMVFQNSALYPHLTVFENMAFGLRARGCPRAEVASRVKGAAAQLGLAGSLARRPQALSGGERQRVALGRALVRQPRVFLLDEPFSSLDAPLRSALRAELWELHRRLGTTIVHVTHDQAEALALGDRVAVLERGRLAQVGTPGDIYAAPASRFVAEFIGNPPMNVVPCEIVGRESSLVIQLLGGTTSESCVADLKDSPGWASPLARRGGAPSRADLGLRAEHLVIRELRDSAAALPPPLLEAPAEVRKLEAMGHETLARLAVGPHNLVARLPGEARIRVGDRVTVGLDVTHAVWFDPESGAAWR